MTYPPLLFSRAAAASAAGSHVECRFLLWFIRVSPFEDKAKRFCMFRTQNETEWTQRDTLDLIRQMNQQHRRSKNVATRISALRNGVSNASHRHRVMDFSQETQATLDQMRCQPRGPRIRFRQQRFARSSTRRTRRTLHRAGYSWMKRTPRSASRRASRTLLAKADAGSAGLAPYWSSVACVS